MGVQPESGDQLDLLVLGSGVAGLSAAVRAADDPSFRVGVLTKAELSQATTRWAQGGVAAVLGDDPDSTDLHLADTLAAGAGLCDVDAVRILVDEGPGRVNELIALGAAFDRDPDGTLQLAREGGHSVPRVVHAGGAATGVEVERALVVAVRRTAAAIFENWFAKDLLVEDGRCVGVTAIAPDGEIVEVRARNVLMATGGAGQLFAVTTNPHVASGDGMAMALRAGAAVADIEFVQFHPTALHHPAMPRPLLSEALRGHGALLRDGSGERFIDELEPRDVVSRAMARRMREQGVEHMWLDATGLENFSERFPTIEDSLRKVGLDPSRDWLPIAPAAHYTCGGVVSDLRGATSLPGLWVAGEASCAGIHGANRLASNSLLEGMVYAPRAVEAILEGVETPEASGAMRAVLTPKTSDISGKVLALDLDPHKTGVADAPNAARDRLQRAMTVGAGVVRTQETLTDALQTVQLVRGSVIELANDGDVAAAEVVNLADVAAAVVVAAIERTESRGSHTRDDYPETDDAQRHRLIFA